MATLGPAISSLRASLTLLDSSISILDEGVSDFPRLRKVLQTQRHFELLPETNLKAAQQSLAEEVSPAIEQLLSTAESYINQLGRKEQSLKARYELLEGRLEAGQRKEARVSNFNMRVQSAGPQALQAKKMQQKKDQLEFAIERLELQLKQKERDLRKSMAFVRDDA